MLTPSSVLSGVIAQLSWSEQDTQGGEAQDAASPNMTMEVDWDLGVSGHSDDTNEEDEVLPILPVSVCLLTTCNQQSAAFMKI